MEEAEEEEEDDRARRSVRDMADELDDADEDSAIVARRSGSITSRIHVESTASSSVGNRPRLHRNKAVWENTRGCKS